ncbi:helix-turn-helix domain-containing protein [Clostridioides difficile]
MDKELVGQLYANGLSAKEIAEELNVKVGAIKMCIQRNFKEFKTIHLKNRKHLKFYENEVKKITKYESKKYMSDKTFILKNRSLYETKEDGDIVLKKNIGCAIPWDVPRRLTNEFKSC